MSSNNSTIPDSLPNSSTLTHQTPAAGLASKMIRLRGKRSSLRNLIYVKQMQFKNQTQPSRSLKAIPNLQQNLLTNTRDSYYFALDTKQLASASGKAKSPKMNKPMLMRRVVDFGKANKSE